MRQEQGKIEGGRDAMGGAAHINILPIVRSFKKPHASLRKSASRRALFAFVRRGSLLGAFLIGLSGDNQAATA